MGLSSFWLMDNANCPSLGNQPTSNIKDLQGKEQCDHSHCEPTDDLHVVNENNEEATEEVILGKEFMDVESASKFYNNYGGKHGFNVRIRNSRKNIENFVTWVRYCCSKEGFRIKDKRRTNASYSQPVTRCGCQAHLTIQLQKNGNFKVVSFQKNHNHPLISTPLKHLLKVNRNISEAQKAHADDAECSGFSIKATVELMSREVGGPENLGFSHKDYMNYIHRKRMSKMEKGDAGAILQYFQKMQSENSSYFYSIQLDEDDMITNIFWADARSVSDYSLFGDVLCFDTTYRTNEYGRPFAPFVGVNHHKQTTLFGAALLYDETTESFRWLFETFLSAMSSKQPITILTDQSAAMAKAIKDVFPQATHRLCVWHLYQNAAKNLSHVFHGSSEFVDDFSNCMYDYEFENEWLLAWNDMLEKYSLQENKWLNNLFELREKWALVYGRHTFTADMKSTQRSECMNNVLKKYLRPEHNLLRYEDSAQNVHCSCKKFTFVGILCVHALKVLDKKNVKKIPPQYILK
ncbi:protein FAR1-RELATED SEQUENCE 5-like [Rosa rugosa]|uniref:protein FAR1-RELATED SEQUENCE 5-like n=1 Tax=Rosa rugosa TaxID=74645 RepID=UPI002B41781F|nr:protein FAR1-RELATED SEQUENCE 5-like [Rosa rugosa]